eukprot:TRINITY_DN507_c0_g1_i2.p1 TRINITY_DN507_c0_g1~~TRINITY_DN507_c0_g1_i2.p1  ORF type:complete len:201 (+),score=59.56 TRINITY_DN507_c0_g1_i2:55-657(+)
MAVQMMAKFDGLESPLPPPGLEMFGPGSTISLEEARSACGQEDDSASDAGISECSTADTYFQRDSSGTGSDYCPGSVLKMSASLMDSESEAADEPLRLQLEVALPEAPRGCPGCPSIGSAGHHLGLCKPCDFVERGGCRQGYDCQFCHLCPPGENRRRKKAKQAASRMQSLMASAAMWPQMSQSAKPKATAKMLSLDNLL